MFFKLNENCILNNNVVYDYLNGINIELGKETSMRLKELIAGDPLSARDMDLIQELLDQNVGNVYENNVFVKNISYTNPKFIQSYDSFPFELRQATIEVTGECNLNCVFCNSSNKVYRSCGCKKWNSDLLLEEGQWMDVARQLIKLGIKDICFSGGEPFLRAELLIELVEYFAKNNIISTIYTNGTLLTETLCEQLSKYKAIFIVQYYSTALNTYQSITGCDDSVFCNLNKAIDILQEKACNFKIALTVGSFNENEICDCEAYLKDNNIPYYISYIFPNSPHASAKYLNEILNAKERAYPVNLNSIDYLRHRNVCFSNNIFVSADGNVYPCMMLRAFRLGSLLENKLYELFLKEDYKHFWELSKSKVSNCAECGYNLQCVDCRALEYSANNDLYGMKYCNKISSNR